MGKNKTPPSPEELEQLMAGLDDQAPASRAPKRKFFGDAVETDDAPAAKRGRPSNDESSADEPVDRHQIRSFLDSDHKGDGHDGGHSTGGGGGGGQGHHDDHHSGPSGSGPGGHQGSDYGGYSPYHGGPQMAGNYGHDHDFGSPYSPHRPASDSDGGSGRSYNDPDHQRGYHPQDGMNDHALNQMHDAHGQGNEPVAHGQNMGWTSPVTSSSLQAYPGAENSSIDMPFGGDISDVGLLGHSKKDGGFLNQSLTVAVEGSLAPGGISTGGFDLTLSGDTTLQKVSPTFVDVSGITVGSEGQSAEMAAQHAARNSRQH